MARLLYLPTQSPKYEPTDQPLILLDLVVLVCILLASDEASLIPFPFLQAPLMCSVGRKETFRKTLSLKKKKNFFIPSSKRNFADALLI